MAHPHSTRFQSGSAVAAGQGLHAPAPCLNSSPSRPEYMASAFLSAATFLRFMPSSAWASGGQRVHAARAVRHAGTRARWPGAQLARAAACVGHWGCATRGLTSLPELLLPLHGLQRVLQRH